MNLLQHLQLFCGRTTCSTPLRSRFPQHRGQYGVTEGGGRDGVAGGGGWYGVAEGN